MTDWNSDCGRVRLICGDCLDVLGQLEEGSVGAVVTDPPYGIGYRHGGGVRGVKAAVGQTKSASARGCMPVIGDDQPFDPSHLAGFDRVLMWGADNYRNRLPDGGTFLAWDKTDGRGPKDTFLDAEFAWCNWREPRNVFRWLWKGMVCKKVGENNGLRMHTTQKPIALMVWCVNLADRAIVIDPYMGSGTTGIACIRTGRKFIGIEIDPTYYEIAKKRIQAELAQGRLFA